jgi:hypothetical protein
MLLSFKCSIWPSPPFNIKYIIINIKSTPIIIRFNISITYTGMNENLDAIANFEDAWKDLDHPVFTCKDHNTWRAFSHKYPRYLYNFVSGDAIFCIPPYPFAGEGN